MADKPICLDEYAFALPELARIAAIPEPHVRKWLTREIWTGGRRNLAGRLMFCLRDAIEVQVIESLVSHACMGPSDAAPIAHEVAEYIAAAAPKGGNLGPIHVTHALGELRVTVSPPSGPAWPFPYVTVPTDGILADIVRRTRELASVAG